MRYAERKRKKTHETRDDERKARDGTVTRVEM